MEFKFLKYSKIYFIFTALIMAAGIFSLFYFGLNYGIEFTGGNLIQVEYKEKRPSNDQIHKTLSSFNLNEDIQPFGERGVIIRIQDIPQDKKNDILIKLRDEGIAEEKTVVEMIGPVIGRELKEKTKAMIILSLLVMLFYIAFAFRKLARPIKSWQYGISAIFTLSHDILIPLAVFAVLGKFYGVQITIPIVVALLTVIGYAINNTVVVFDRVRENTFKTGNSALYPEIVDKSLNETLSRQLGTSLTTLFPLIAIYFFGGETLKYFALVLILGILAGIYSSLLLAAPILVSWARKTGKII